MRINQIIFTVIVTNILNFTAPLLLGQYAGGTGTPEDPFLIETAEQMNTIGLHREHWNKNFKLIADIDLSGYTGEQYNIIGFLTKDNTTYFPFTGVFDGNDHYIKNFTYSSDKINVNDVGIFGQAGANSLIFNLTLIDPNIDVHSPAGALVGVLSEGNVDNCSVRGGSVSGYSAVGGLVGNNWVDSGESNITNCCSTANVSGDEWVGGLVGANFGLIEECLATGNVSGNVDIGGLVGWNGMLAGWPGKGNIINCYATGSVSGDRNVGGLTGSGSNSTIIIKCYATGSISGNSSVGGLIGRNSGTVTNSFWDMDSSGLATSDGGTGKPAVSMRSKRPFIWAGWDFEEVWTIEEGEDYPRLLCETKTASEKPVGDLNGDRIVDEKDLSILEQNWMKVYPVTCWKFDDISGAVVPDCAGDNDGYIHGDPTWYPQSSVDSALELDGIDDYLSADYILNPAEGAFSVFIWIRGGLPGQVIVSQAGGANWLMADSSEGKLMTMLSVSGRSGGPLHSQSVITDGLWHRVGLVWDGSYRFLYVDDIEVAKDTSQLGRLVGSDEAIYLGCGKNLESVSFFSGMIDDFKIYDRAVTP
jgi:hypothetical protein